MDRAVGPLAEHHECASADAADADHLLGYVHKPVLAEQASQRRFQRATVGQEPMAQLVI